MTKTEPFTLGIGRSCVLFEDFDDSTSTSTENDLTKDSVLNVTATIGDSTKRFLGKVVSNKFINGDELSTSGFFYQNKHYEQILILDVDFDISE